MTDVQSYEQRVSRLADARRKDSAAKRAAVLKAIAELRREDRWITRRVVIARAGVHRNFLHRHKDLAALVDEAAGGKRPATISALRIESLATACSPSSQRQSSATAHCSRKCRSSSGDSEL